MCVLYMQQLRAHALIAQKPMYTQTYTHTYILKHTEFGCLQC